MKQATADAAYEIEKENQRKTIEVTSADANIAKQEREVLLKSKEAEAMDKKAEAYQKYTGAAVAEMLIKVLPDVAGKIAEPLTQIDKITVIGSGNDSSSIDSVAGNVPGVMTKLFESMKETTGIDLGEIVRANTYDAKVTRNVNFSGIPASDNDTNVVVQAADSVRKQDEKKPEKPVKPVEEKPVEKKADNDKMSWEK